MKWLGPFVGALLGLRFGLGGLLSGTVIGYLVQHLLTSRSRAARSDLGQTLFPMMGYVARLDGYVSTREVALAEQLFDQFELEGSERALAVSLFNEGRSAGFDPNRCLAQFVAQFAMRSDAAANLLSTLVAVAFADGTLDLQERDGIAALALQLGFRRDELQREFERQAPQVAIPASMTRESAFQELGLKPDASAAEIKLAYRRLISQYHPDKLEGAGVRGDALKGAQLKAKQVRAAYELLCELMKIS